MTDPRPANSLDRQFVTDVTRAVQEGGMHAIEAGAAELDQVKQGWGIEIHLLPRNKNAAAVVAQVQPPNQVILYLGKFGNAAETLSDDRSETIAEVRSLVRAVVDGGYSEDVSPDGGRIAGRLRLKDREIKVQTNVILGRYFRKNWRHRKYAPYLTG